MNTTQGHLAAIILCAGKGRRMKAPRTPKVCFPIVGKPAISYLLGELERLNIDPVILVTGYLAGKVIDTVGPLFPEVIYTFQKTLRGTGHAARQGAKILQKMGFEGDILIAAGDKIIEKRALEKLIQCFYASKADMALLAAPKEHWPNAGRLVQDNEGNVLGVVEKADLEQARGNNAPIRVGVRSLTATEIERSSAWVNQAVYIFRSPALFAALEKLDTHNAQQEEYLTDTVSSLASHGKKIIPVPVDDWQDVLGFNTPAELVTIEEHFHKKSLERLESEGTEPDPACFKKPTEWLRILDSPGPDVITLLQQIYGKDPHFLEKKRRQLAETVQLFLENFGDMEPVTIIRAPGRVNLMGRHVDHRGGRSNLMAINREHILVARGRTDNRVRARNMSFRQFQEVEFSLDELLEKEPLDDWHEYVNSERVIQMVRDLQGDWGNYLKAPMLRLQQEEKQRRIHGVDCVVNGDIPMAAGLSSSSALVVAMADALVLTNNLQYSAHDLVDLCGEGEWFVGTRGGSGDHAAIKLSQFGRVAHVGFHPFTIFEYVPFPEQAVLVICDSRVQARKSEGAREAFNERIASYEFAVHLFKKRFPLYAPLITHLRDIEPETLHIKPATLYRMVLEIPEQISPVNLRNELGTDLFNRITQTHSVPDCYYLRGRLLYGICECARSKEALPILRRGDLEALGFLMSCSHDGDRVQDKTGNPFTVDISDSKIHQLIDDLQSEDPARVIRAQLPFQPGCYACSIPALDRMVDIALATPGVYGAQLSGAGLGGCMMALVDKSQAQTLKERMLREYYEKDDLEPAILSVAPIAGSGPLFLR